MMSSEYLALPETTFFCWEDLLGFFEGPEFDGKLSYHYNRELFWFQVEEEEGYCYTLYATLDNLTFYRFWISKTEGFLGNKVNRAVLNPDIQGFADEGDVFLWFIYFYLYRGDVDAMARKLDRQFCAMVRKKR